MPQLLAFLQTDCPTCRLITPYLNAIANDAVPVKGISQDDDSATREFSQQMQVKFPMELDSGFQLSKQFDLITVPTLLVIDDHDHVLRREAGFDKKSLNEIAEMFGHKPVASPHDGAPATKPGCSSRHREPHTEDAAAPALNAYATHGARASRIELNEADDPYEYCYAMFGDALPV